MHPAVATPRCCRLLVLAGLLLGLLLWAASSAAQALPAIDLYHASQNDNLAHRMQGLDGSNLTLLSPAAALATPGWLNVAEQPQLLLAPKRHAVLWLQGVFTNSGPESLLRWLNLAPWRLNQVDVWLLDAATGTVRQQIKVGMDVPLSARPIYDSRSLIPLSLAAGESVRLVLRIDSVNRPRLSLTSWEPLAYSEAASQRILRHSIFLAAILTLCVVLLLQRNLTYLLVGLWMLAQFVLEAEKEGYISQLLFPESPRYAFNLLFLASLWGVGMFLIASVYLLGLSHHRRWRWVAPVVAGVAVLSAAVASFLDGAQIRLIMPALFVGTLAFWLVLVPAAWKVKRKWQRLILGMLALDWLIALGSLVSYAFNLYSVSEFFGIQLMIKAALALGLLLIYAQQQRAYKHSLETQLWQKEMAERAQLEQAVQERTQALHAALETAEQAVAARDNFLRRVSHDLKSPLTSIMGYAQLLRVERGRVGQMSGIIHNSANHMLNLVTRLIDYARDVKHAEVRSVDIYLYAFLDSLKHEARILSSRQANRFRLELPPSLCPVIRCDETFLREILLNLLENAAKYTREGDITLSVSVQQESAGSHVELSFVITDTGCGLSPAQLAQVFEPFYRAERSGEGVGLGLAIVGELVRKLGGHIQMHSEPGLGTRVELSLPVERGQESADNALLRLPQHMLPQYDASGRRAWLVEDVPAIRTLLVMELETLGFQVCEFAEAEAALAVLEKTEALPDLVLTDYCLPGATGDVLLQAIKKHQVDIPVILLSATWNIQPTAALAPGGYVACLGKPVDLVLLRHEVARACGLKARAAVVPVQECHEAVQAELVEALCLSSPPTSSGRTELNHLVACSLDEASLQQLQDWQQLGAVTDILEWCDDYLGRCPTQGPQQTALIKEIRRLAERGDFRGLEERLQRFPESAAPSGSAS